MRRIAAISTNWIKLEEVLRSLIAACSFPFFNICLVALEVNNRVKRCDTNVYDTKALRYEYGAIPVESITHVGLTKDSE